MSEERKFEIIWDGEYYPQIKGFRIQSVEDWTKIIEALNEHLSWGKVRIESEKGQPIFLYEFKFSGSFAVSFTEFDRLPTSEEIWWDGRDSEGLKKDFEKLFNFTTA